MCHSLFLLSDLSVFPSISDSIYISFLGIFPISCLLLFVKITHKVQLMLPICVWAWDNPLEREQPTSGCTTEE